MDNRPIGVFDSGLGGLTGVRELRKRLPHEDIIYFGDTGRVPYGSRSPETILQYARQDVAILTYNSEGIVCERDQDVWANKECFTTKLPMLHVDDLASYVDYPICKMLITLDPARRDAVCAAGKEQFAGRIDLYPSSPFFIEAVPLGVAKDRSLAALLERMGLTRENLMACGDGLNDRSMISYAGVGVAMQNAEDAVKAVADYVTAADNNHDGVAEAVEKFILN